MKYILLKFYYKTVQSNYGLLIFMLIFNQTVFSQNPGNEKGYNIWEQNIKVKNNNPDLLNYHAPLKSVKEKIIKKAINNKYSFFMVFKSDEKEETKLVKIRDGRNKFFFTNQRIISNKDKPYDKKVNNGMFVSFLTQYTKNVKFNNYFKIYDEVIKNKESKNKIYEILYYPKFLKPVALAKVQTYFSIKYGISLPNESFYINSKNDTIWNPKNNKGYNNRITGLALDKKLNLEQYKSHNSRYKNLSVTFNKESANVSNTNFYVLFGDNNQDIKFSTNTEKPNFKNLNRKWKVNIATDNSDFIPQANFDFSLDLTVNKEDELAVLWLVIDTKNTKVFNYDTATYIKGELIDNTYHFNNVSLNKQALFSFVTTPELFCAVNTKQPSCLKNNLGELAININGGVAPYSINLNAENFDKTASIIDTDFEFSEIPEGTYNLLVTDSNGQTYNETIVLKSNFDVVNLESKWFLEDLKNGVEIMPTGKSKVLNELTYSWFFNEELVSTAQTFTAMNYGIYQLVVKNKEGCQQKFNFSVETKSNLLTEGISVYPNPVDINQNFRVSFDFEKENDVNVSIYSLEGKLMESNDYKGIKKQSKFYAINVTGVYLVVIKSSNKFITKRIIIK